MNKRGLSILFATVFILASVSVFASKVSDDRSVYFRGAILEEFYYEPGDDVSLIIGVENRAGIDLEDTSVRIIVYDIPLFEVSREQNIDSDADEVTTFFVNFRLPHDIQPGVYLTRITVSNDEFSRVIHREFTVV